MKVITDYFTPPLTQKKPIKKSKNSVEQTVCPVEVNPEALLSDENDEVYYETRKIKIRLADPNVPDSYVCEIYDTSLEEEETAPSVSIPETHDVKPRETNGSAFDVLMAGGEKVKTEKPVRKRSRSKKLKTPDESECSSDEALMFVKKKLKTCDNATKRETVELPLRRRTRSSGSDNVEATVATQVSSHGRKQQSIPIKSKQTGGSIKNFFRSVDNDHVKKDLERKTRHPVKKAIEKVLIPPAKSEQKRKCTSKRSQITINKKNTLNDRLSKKAEASEKEITTRRHSKRLGEKNEVISPDRCNYDRNGKESSRTDSSPYKDCRVILHKMPFPKPLAPLFQKVPKKDAVAPEVLKARQEFLQSGLPSAVRKKVEAMKALEAEEISFFPAICHVQQRSDETVWSKRSIGLNLLRTEDYAGSPLRWKTIMCTRCPKSDHFKGKTKKANVDDNIIDNLQTVYKNVKINSLYQALKKGIIKSKEGINENEEPWTEKYRPGSGEILSNNQTVKKLGKWLMAWKRYGEDLRISKKSTDNGESSDDFVTSDEEGHSTRAPVTACLLEGPASSGKTAVVHALAAEMDFHIVEINSSSKRSGKKMLADLQEATQSHKILQEANGNVSRSMPGSGKDAMTVIVVEEADIMFEEQDDGFISGLQNLITTAKRPVLLLTSDASVNHLEKFRSSSTLQLSMVRPHLSASCAVLELISLLEGVSPSRSSLLQLLSRNNLDLRQSLLELQFWLQCGNTDSNAWKALCFASLTADRVWWDSNQMLFQKDLWHSTPPLRACDSPTNQSDTGEEKETVKPQNNVVHANFLTYYESLSICDVLAGRRLDHPSELKYCNVRVKDSSYLDDDTRAENAREIEMRNDLEVEILTRSVCCFQLKTASENKTDCTQLGMPTREVRWIASRRRAMNELLDVVPLRSGKLGRHCDYLPALRAICRSEQLRSETNTKRRNRFYHYIRTLGGTPTGTNLSINCRTFCEKS